MRIIKQGHGSPTQGSLLDFFYNLKKLEKAFEILHIKVGSLTSFL